MPLDTPASCFWLILGAAIQLLGFGRWMTPLAAWLAPVFLLHFVHSQPTLAGVLWLWLALAIAMGVSLRGIVPIPGLAYLALPVLWGLLGSLPFMVDRLVVALVPGLWATFVFPVAWTAMEFLNARLNPYGTWGASGYTQHGVLPLMQLASVTGIWGIGFSDRLVRRPGELVVEPAVRVGCGAARSTELRRCCEHNCAAWRPARRLGARASDRAHRRHRLAQGYHRAHGIPPRGGAGSDRGRTRTAQARQ